MWKVLILSQKVMQFVMNKFVLLRFCYLYIILPWVQLDVQETYITTANFFRLWQKHELGFIECSTLEHKASMLLHFLFLQSWKQPFCFKQIQESVILHMQYVGNYTDKNFLTIPTS